MILFFCFESHCTMFYNETMFVWPWSNCGYNWNKSVEPTSPLVEILAIILDTQTFLNYVFIVGFCSSYFVANFFNGYRGRAENILTEVGQVLYAIILGFCFHLFGIVWNVKFLWIIALIVSSTITIVHNLKI